MLFFTCKHVKMRFLSLIFWICFSFVKIIIIRVDWHMLKQAFPQTINEFSTNFRNWKNPLYYFTQKLKLSTSCH